VRRIFIVMLVAGCATNTPEPMIDFDELAQQITVTHKVYIFGQYCELDNDNQRVIACDAPETALAESDE